MKMKCGRIIVKKMKSKRKCLKPDKAAQLKMIEKEEE